eukprot:scaffold11416_cov76-Phaeocystis_antarctica.AAC.2
MPCELVARLACAVEPRDPLIGVRLDPVARGATEGLTLGHARTEVGHELADAREAVEHRVRLGRDCLQLGPGCLVHARYQVGTVLRVLFARPHHLEVLLLADGEHRRAEVQEFLVGGRGPVERVREGEPGDRVLVAVFLGVADEVEAHPCIVCYNDRHAFGLVGGAVAREVPSLRAVVALGMQIFREVAIVGVATARGALRRSNAGCVVLDVSGDSGIVVEPLARID